ncbi:hypothetical protein Apa02nite_025180 [Actinoplanes palleronii]|uniref:Glycosyltransferase subfamily 4-like N-terminal domain-containing protein n=1 Tax=Actinoplanes palleronii TaxID=113570 RepID=A0ABQ4B6Y2_9ACTN|nr:hypothetical protein Apa02nite_025180 [Actinoplanes palleronii]
MRIVRIANFAHATSGGLRTALRELGRGYQEAGHRAVPVVPGPGASDEHFSYGRVLTVPGPGAGRAVSLVESGRRVSRRASAGPGPRGGPGRPEVGQLPMVACGPAYFFSSAGTSAAASRVYA